MTTRKRVRRGGGVHAPAHLIAAVFHRRDILLECIGPWLSLQDVGALCSVDRETRRILERVTPTHPVTLLRRCHANHGTFLAAPRDWMKAVIDADHIPALRHLLTWARALHAAQPNSKHHYKFARVATCYLFVGLPYAIKQGRVAVCDAIMAWHRSVAYADDMQRPLHNWGLSREMLFKALWKAVYRGMGSAVRVLLDTHFAHGFGSVLPLDADETGHFTSMEKRKLLSACFGAGDRVNVEYFTSMYCGAIVAVHARDWRHPFYRQLLAEGRSAEFVDYLRVCSDEFTMPGAVRTALGNLEPAIVKYCFARCTAAEIATLQADFVAAFKKSEFVFRVVLGELQEYPDSKRSLKRLVRIQERLRWLRHVLCTHYGVDWEKFHPDVHSFEDYRAWTGNHPKRRY